VSRCLSKGKLKKEEGGVEKRASGGVRTYRDLVAWQKAMDLAEQVYRATKGFPAE